MNQVWTNTHFIRNEVRFESDYNKNDKIIMKNQTIQTQFMFHSVKTYLNLIHSLLVTSSKYNL